MAKNWFVCRNRNGMYYLKKSDCTSIQEFWDTHTFMFTAVYGPSDKQSAIECRDDLIEANKNDIDFTRPDGMINIDLDGYDFPDDDDYAGLIS